MMMITSYDNDNYHITIIMITNYSCCFTVLQHDQSVKRSSDSVPPPAKRPATSVDLSGIPDGTLGEWLCEHTMHDLLY